MPTRIAINGFGRIGRTAFQCALEHPALEVVALNDLAEPLNLAYLLKYDSVYGRYPKKVVASKEGIQVDGQEYASLAEADPTKIPWQQLGVDLVLECTGVFLDREGAGKHLKAGAKTVIISAPAKSDDIPTYLMGVNHQDFDPKQDTIISNASCTTNALAPVAKVLHENLGIAKCLMTTVHSYTSSQALVDAPSNRDYRRGRAASLNISPSTTGAALAAAKTIPDLVGRFDGLAVRVPTPCVSLVDLVAVVQKKTTPQEVNALFEQASQKEMKGILAVSREPLVSTDYIKNPFSGVVDLEMTRVVQDDLVKIFVWYDNEWGYSMRLVELAAYVGQKISS